VINITHENGAQLSASQSPAEMQRKWHMHIWTRHFQLDFWDSWTSNI